MFFFWEPVYYSSNMYFNYVHIHSCTSAYSHSNVWHVIPVLIVSMYMSLFSEATKNTLAPLDVEVTVGESILLQCSASYDPSFDVTFLWSVNSYVINFATDFEHYEQLMVRIKERKSALC